MIGSLDAGFDAVTTAEVDVDCAVPDIGRSVDGPRTTGATGRSVRTVDRTTVRDGAERERRNDPRPATALARERSTDRERDNGGSDMGDGA